MGVKTEGSHVLDSVTRWTGMPSLGGNVINLALDVSRLRFACDIQAEQGHGLLGSKLCSP